MESKGALLDRILPVAPDLKESKTVSLWKSISSSSPEANPFASLSEPTRVEARSPTSEVRGALLLWDEKKIAETGEACPVEDSDVDVVCVCRTGVVGLRRGAEEEEEDKPSLAKSMLKLDSRDSGGNGEELFRLRA